MVQPSLFSQLASVNPALSACLAETAEYLAAPGAPRLSDEQRALALGIARRLVGDVADRLGWTIDSAALWRDWSDAGVPAATQLAALCFARGEEHRWREQGMPPGGEAAASPVDDAGEVDALVPAIADGPQSEVARAYLDLQIADRRRFDAFGHPCIAIDDLEPDLLRTLLLDVAAWQLLRAGKDAAEAARLGEAVRAALAAHAPGRGIDRAAARYHDALVDTDTLAAAAGDAIARHDWTALIALAAAAHTYRYDGMALALLSAEPAQLAPLLQPILRDHAALAPLEGALAMLANRAVASAASGDRAARSHAQAAKSDHGGDRIEGEPR